MAKRYSGNVFASVTSATQCSSSARIAIAGSAIAAPNAVSKPASSSDGAPTAAISGVRKDGSIIVTVSAITGAVAGKCKRT
jgi:hypothetical protein